MDIKEFREGRLIKYKLINDKNMIVEIINLGGVITKILVPDYNGNYENVILAYKDLDDYLENPSKLGCVLGRTAGRIGNAEVSINGILYNLPKNNNHNSLHGGVKGFSYKFWTGETIINNDEAILKLTYLSEDGEEGYPGNLKVEINYILNNNNELKIAYKAISDKDTLVNLTNHSYFNLSGNCKRNILGQELYINGDNICELDKYLIPNGNFLSVKGTPFDFTEMKSIGKDIEQKNQQLNYGNGYDHPWVLNSNKKISATLYDKISRRGMDIITDQKAIVCYTMNFTDSLILEHGKAGNVREAICFEAQNLPIGYNNCFMEESLLKANEEYRNETIFRFYLK